MKPALDILIGVIGIATVLDWEKIILACGSLGVGAIVSKLIDRQKDRQSAARDRILAESEVKLEAVQAELVKQQARGEEVDLMVEATRALLENARMAAETLAESEKRNEELRKRNEELRKRAVKLLDELLKAREQLSLAKADLTAAKRETEWQGDRISTLEAAVLEHERHVHNCEQELISLRKELEKTKTQLISMAGDQ